MKTVSHTNTLFYYDGVQVFEGRDPIGGHYVGVAIPGVEGADRYLIVGVEPERLRQFRAGLLDLRALVVQRADSEWFISSPQANLHAALSLEAQTTPLSEATFLPEPGFLLHDQQAAETPHRSPFKAI